MSVDRNTVVFFDASCLVAASGSPTGGSGFLLTVCSRGFLKVTVSQPVLLEAQRNVAEQLRPGALDTFQRLIATTPMTVTPIPPKKERHHYQKLVGEKDEHVLAAAVESRATFLVTLDKPLKKRVNKANLSLRAISPGDFIKTVFTEHPDYPSIR